MNNNTDSPLETETFGGSTAGLRLTDRAVPVVVNSNSTYVPQHHADRADTLLTPPPDVSARPVSEAAE